MNRQHFTNGSGYIFVEGEIDENQIHGTGESYYPRLIVPVKLRFNPIQIPDTDYLFTSMDAKLKVQNTLLADAMPYRLEIVQHSLLSVLCDLTAHLEFPLESRRIAHLEFLRDGKDLPLQLELNIASEEHGLSPGIEKVKRPPTWGLRWFRPQRATLEFTVPRSVWVERVLPKVGHGMIHVVELPAVPLAACQALKHSYDALRLGQSLHTQGLYDEAVNKCRIALEPFFDYIPVDATNKDSRKIPELKKVWQIRLGEATYDWLNRTLVTIKVAANPTAHSPNPHFDQFESQMLMAIATTVIAYAARSLDAEKDK